MELATNYNPKILSEIVTKPILEKGVISWVGNKYCIGKHVWPVQLMPGELFLQVSEKEDDLKIAEFHKIRCRCLIPSGEWVDLFFDTLSDAFVRFGVANVSELSKYCQVYVVVNAIALAETVEYELYWYGGSWVVGEVAHPIMVMMLVVEKLPVRNTMGN